MGAESCGQSNMALIVPWPLRPLLASATGPQLFPTHITSGPLFLPYSTPPLHHRPQESWRPLLRHTTLVCHSLSICQFTPHCPRVPVTASLPVPLHTDPWDPQLPHSRSSCPMPLILHPCLTWHRSTGAPRDFLFLCSVRCQHPLPFPPLYCLSLGESGRISCTRLIIVAFLFLLSPVNLITQLAQSVKKPGKFLDRLQNKIVGVRLVPSQ
ncbi:hypothetical protein NDU88_004855 [Pleurodeles waltl]|uniref:Uncharacterized protein n=1 Tax=Pleurodeles waltl TaxID=8319 RepID=A0AAV7PL03_PLEWA|nr:hypothetical protein NDU88_004855 [Pleurodeles waltl]